MKIARWEIIEVEQSDDHGSQFNIRLLLTYPICGHECGTEKLGSSSQSPIRYLQAQYARSKLVKFVPTLLDVPNRHTPL